jgi:hypothetical protein
MRGGSAIHIAWGELGVVVGVAERVAQPSIVSWKRRHDVSRWLLGKALRFAEAAYDESIGNESRVDGERDSGVHPDRKTCEKSEVGS